MARRMFYVQEIAGETATIRGDTAQHIRKVLRGERGQRYEISDGSTLWLAELADFGKETVVFQLLEPLEATRPPVRLHLLASLIKFDAFEWMLEKATELGVEKVTPVYALRSDKGLDQAARKRRERWLRIVAEAGQQCRRLSPPVLNDVVSLQEALKCAADVRLWLEEQRGASPILKSLPEHRCADDVVALLCGPEGGWDDRERKQAESADWKAVSLGSQILRAETAAVAGLAVIGVAWQ